jgi:hypothetical protein
VLKASNQKFSIDNFFATPYTYDKHIPIAQTHKLDVKKKL